ncbi:Tumour necrosis factor receptor superfamily member 19 [Halobacillus karajensis]|uniref:Tumour necrosis factor receptor superfamily member 19 n=1 Tax=Halobacillus karajensis TaxID=195088 RepID=A0A059NYR9_9BACI|nr:YtzI protein [Halobacillus karajensis]CDQ19279.1 Tumour necrosis factor receptor superfamily member 19 [Halobacillus karajensis]CDQ22647.1 Tumour necrosis factor receptor superfamily member 19 [Halobacillus karajensis]CDQ26129.1 Tumour necrosis factor receptor superfamily member 19 [Halobacillus karajensis]SEH38948.1 Tumour necrosis factor receptor superfamily member 19 [Halobacillus karajensis]
MAFTVIMLVCIAIVLGIAAMFGMAVSKGYEYKHTVDPLPDEDHLEEDHKKADA